MRTGSPDLAAILPTVIQAEGIITNPYTVFITGIDQYTLANTNLELQNLDASQHDIASGGVPNTTAAQKAQAGFL
jgi:hypothetical protein